MRVALLVPLQGCTAQRNLWSALGKCLRRAHPPQTPNDSGADSFAGSLVMVCLCFILMVLVAIYTANTAANMTATRLSTEVTSLADLQASARLVGSWEVRRGRRAAWPGRRALLLLACRAAAPLELQPPASMSCPNVQGAAVWPPGPHTFPTPSPSPLPLRRAMLSTCCSATCAPWGSPWTPPPRSAPSWTPWSAAPCRRLSWSAPRCRRGGKGRERGNGGERYRGPGGRGERRGPPSGSQRCLPSQPAASRPSCCACCAWQAMTWSLCQVKLVGQPFDVMVRNRGEKPRPAAAADCPPGVCPAPA